MKNTKYICNIYSTLSGINDDDIRESLEELDSALSSIGYTLAYNPDGRSGVIIKMGDSND